MPSSVCNTDVNIVAALSLNRVIGRGGSIPWHINADIKHFKSLTMNSTVIMGAHTWQSIGHPLQGRTVIVLTHNSARLGIATESKEICTSSIHNSINTASIDNITTKPLEDVFAAPSLPDAIGIARCIALPVWIAGGEHVYQEALPLCNKLFLTEVMTDVDGDTYFPPFNRELYTIEESAPQEGGTCDGKRVRYRYVTYTRRMTHKCRF